MLDYILAIAIRRWLRGFRIARGLITASRQPAKKQLSGKYS